MQNPINAVATQPEVSTTHLAAQQPKAIPTHKAAYTPPVLTMYGSVSALTLGNGGSGIDGLGQQSLVPSDPRVKENIVRVGQHHLGIGLYLFNYKAEFRAAWGSGRQFGVMANEVEAVIPAAVTTHADGYQRVNYQMLGINCALN